MLIALLEPNCHQRYFKVEMLFWRKNHNSKKNTKSPHQNIDFQNDIDWSPCIEKGREMVQNTSPDFKESVARTFRYEFFLRTPSRIASRNTQNSKNQKIEIFRDELFGGSSDFNHELWSKMESLSVFDVFCTNSECNTTLRSNFKKQTIFVIF